MALFTHRFLNHLSIYRQTLSEQLPIICDKNNAMTFEDDLIAAVFAIFIALVPAMLFAPLVKRHRLPFLWILFDGMVHALSRKLDKRGRGNKALILRGLFTSFLLAFVSIGTAYLLNMLLTEHYTALFWSNAVALSFCIFPLFFYLRWLPALAASSEKIKTGIPDRILESLSAMTAIDLQATDEHTKIRVALNLGIKLFLIGLVGPVFWFMANGLPAALFYAVMALFVLHTSDKTKVVSSYTVTGRMVFDAFNLMPTLICGFVFVIAAAITPSASISQALAGMFVARDKLIGPVDARITSAVAYALGIVMGGSYKTKNGTAYQPWLGPEEGSAKLDHTAVTRVVILQLVAFILILLLLIGSHVVLKHYM